MKWFSIGGIIEEAKRVRWPKKEDLLNDFIVVIIFTIFFGICFVGADFLAALCLRLIGVV